MVGWRFACASIALLLAGCLQQIDTLNEQALPDPQLSTYELDGSAIAPGHAVRVTLLAARDQNITVTSAYAAESPHQACGSLLVDVPPMSFMHEQWEGRSDDGLPSLPPPRFGQMYERAGMPVTSILPRAIQRHTWAASSSDGVGSRSFGRGTADFEGTVPAGEHIFLELSRPLAADGAFPQIKIEGKDPFLVVEEQESIEFDCRVGLEPFDGQFQTLGNGAPLVALGGHLDLSSATNQTYWGLASYNRPFDSDCPVTVATPGAASVTRGTDLCTFAFAGGPGTIRMELARDVLWKFTFAYFHWKGEWHPGCQRVLFEGSCFSF